VLAFCIPTQATDWQNWRGPNHNGISTEKGWDPGKIKAGIKPLWRASIGTGFSAVSVSNGLVYAMGNTGSKAKDVNQHKDIIYCFSEETGKEVWNHAYPQRLDPKLYEGGTLASPTVSSGKLYTISKDGKAFCLDAKTGKEIWHKNLLKDLGIRRATWGQSGSPLIIDDMVIYNVGTKGVALDKNNGNVIWENGKDPGGYATAVPFRMGEQQCVALFGSRDVIGLVASTGKELWRFPWPTKYDVNASAPIITDDTVFISSGYGTGCTLLKLEAGTATEIWRNKNMRNKMNGSVLWKGYIYGVDEGGELRCLDFKTGEFVWAQGGFGQGSLMIADGKLIVMAEKGNLIIAEATSDGYKVISEAQILSPRCWTVPVLANGRIYARNAKGDLVCLDVSTDTQAVSNSINWAQWRGLSRDAKSTETGLLKKWPPSGPTLLWSREGLGKSFSTVSIADGLIYTTGIIDGQGILFAFDLQGNPKWQKSYGPEWVQSTPGARCTPTVDQGHVYVIKGSDQVSQNIPKSAKMAPRYRGYMFRPCLHAATLW
jgi:outer membrane protein assembly factor BamB